MPQKPLDISTPLFYPRAEEQQHHFRVSSRVMPMPPGQTKVFGFAPTWCTTKYLARSCGVFFYCIFLRELPFMHHWGREWLAVEVTAACGGDRDPEQAQRSQRTSPAQGAQADAVTASRRPAVRPGCFTFYAPHDAKAAIKMFAQKGNSSIDEFPFCS